MKVGIIVYSETGNTLGVAEEISKELKKRKISVEIERIELEDKKLPRRDPFVITSSPDISKYDVIILGSLVEAFNLSPVMVNYLNDVDTFEGKDVYCFVTHFFPVPFLGGKTSINKFKRMINCKNGEVVFTGIVDWKNKKRETQIQTIVQSFADLIESL